MGIFASLPSCSRRAHRRFVQCSTLVVLACQAAMALGTLFGGWRIHADDGLPHHTADPLARLLRETGGALTLFGATWFESGFHHPHNHWEYHWSRSCPPGLGGAVERPAP